MRLPVGISDGSQKEIHLHRRDNRFTKLNEQRDKRHQFLPAVPVNERLTAIRKEGSGKFPCELSGQFLQVKSQQQELTILCRYS